MPAAPQQRQIQPLFPAESIGQIVALGFMRVEATRYPATLGNRREWRDKSAQIHLFHFVIGASNFLTSPGTTPGKYDLRDPRYNWDCD
ncbi:hypothetical protein OCU04_001466 [Sclerotinia nivalis]|uniref:Uncharacterized protein n=1 Tax=Sclerotinia nivalis TaxID=352851 RepID=A0A9X0AY83_9HELO|nr:hypothetical protein OCU04_001466 [Sclerotinia nivalis]